MKRSTRKKITKAGDGFFKGLVNAGDSVAAGVQNGIFGGTKINKKVKKGYKPYKTVAQRNPEGLTNRVYIRRWIGSHTDASLADYDKKTSELINKHSISHSLLEVLLIEHNAAKWLTGWARGRVKRMLDDWPQDPPAIYDEEYSGTSMWGVGNDYAGWEAKRERCREIWSRVADSAENEITR